MDKVTVKCRWTIKERRGKLWVPVKQRYNLFTNDGLSQLASALSGGYVPPVYLVLEQNYSTTTAAYSAGATSIALLENVTITGDTQLVMEPGTANQEVVTFSS